MRRTPSVRMRRTARSTGVSAGTALTYHALRLFVEEDAARGTFWSGDGLLELEVVMNPTPLQVLVPRQLE